MAPLLLGLSGLAGAWRPVRIVSHEAKSAGPSNVTGLANLGGGAAAHWQESGLAPNTGYRNCPMHTAALDATINAAQPY